MTDIDELLSIIENPTRRKILEYLTREPSYPLQLSKELGISQQAVMKNLALMEQTGMLTSYPMESSIGPRRTVYVPRQHFTIMVDLHGNMFTARVISAGENSETEAPDMDAEEAMLHLRELESRLEELDSERVRLMEERDSLMNAANQAIRSIEDPVQRKELYRKLDETIGKNNDQEA